MEIILVGILGIMIGSFLNVVILRTPIDQSISFPASHCMSCNTPLRAWHNVPLLSWLFLRGKCAFCGVKISIQYPLIEFLTGLIFLCCAWKFGITYQAFAISMVFALLLALSVIDFRYKMVPDSINLSALTFAIFSVASMSGFVTNFTNALLFTGGFSLLRFYLSYAIKKEAMGEADIMIAATMGAVLGIKLALIAVFLSAVLALPALLLTRTDDEDSQQLPFIPFLAIATWIVLMFNTDISLYLVTLYG